MEQDYILILVQDIVKAMNENPLPISAKYFVLKDIFNQTENAYNEYLAKQMGTMKTSEPQEETMEVAVPIEEAIIKKEGEE